MRNEFEKNAKEGYKVFAEDSYTKNPENREFLNEINKRILKHLNVYDLCSLCQIEKCPYKERISAAAEIMSEYSTDLNKKVKEILGENPHEGRYRRWHWDHGPLVYCDSYQGGLPQNVLNKVKMNNTIYLIGDLNYYSDIIGIQKLLQEEGNIVYVDFLEKENFEKEDVRNSEKSQNLLASYMQKMLFSDEVCLVEKEDEPNNIIMNYIKIYAASIWKINVRYVFIK